jgi:hypothetical protein
VDRRLLRLRVARMPLHGLSMVENLESPRFRSRSPVRVISPQPGKSSRHSHWFGVTCVNVAWHRPPAWREEAPCRDPHAKIPNILETSPNIRLSARRRTPIRVSRNQSEHKRQPSRRATRD